jgi:microcystin-dependent protein
MPLETATSIDGLEPTNPVGATDDIAFGDDHIRMIKLVLKNCLPFLNGRAFRFVQRTVGFNFATTDNFTLNYCNSSITGTLPAASTLGNGWITLVQPTGGAALTVAATGPDVINGVASWVCPNSHIGIVFCSGGGFSAIAVPLLAVPAPVIPAGTRMLFQQTTAPVGWTKDTNPVLNDTALRTVTGAVSGSGTQSFTDVFFLGKNTSGHSLTVAEMPAHAHPGSGGTADSAGTHTHTIPLDLGGTGATTVLDGVGPRSGASVDNSVSVGSSGAHTHSLTLSMASQGGGDSHAHAIPALDLRFIDYIVAVKD